MSREPMDAALERWGDQVYRLALLMTGRAERAERVAGDAFRRAFAATPLDVEQALYTALAHAAVQNRFTLSRLPLPGRSLARIAPRDRLLLGLWLLAAQNGEQLAAIVGTSPQQLVARLDGLLGNEDRVSQGSSGRATAMSVAAPAAQSETEPHLARGDWLRRGLFGDQPAAAHLRLCPACRERVAAWQAEADALAKQLRAIAGDARLPRPVVADLSTGASTTPAPRRTWLYAVMLGVVGLLLVAIVVPWPRSSNQETAAPLTPPALVEAALAKWQTAPAEGTQHRRVRAAPLWNEREPLILDVWQSAAGRHRWEAHRGNVLVEWQLADGRDVLRYGGEPDHASCRWKAGEQTGMVGLREGSLVFAAPPEQQREALAGRLREGAYGTGYVLLRRALAADDLRSLGARQTASGSVTVLRFTDQPADSGREIVLEIDARHQLRAVQALAGAAKTAPRDLWRVLLDEAVDEVALAVPGGGSAPPSEQLLDPACPSVQADTVLPSRELAFVPAPAVLPAALPDGTSAAFFSRYGAQGAAPSLGRLGNISLVVTRPGSRLTLEIASQGWSSSSMPDQPEDADVIERGRWHLVLGRDEDGTRAGWIKPRDTSNQWSTWYQVWVSGWSDDELAGFIEGLALFDVLDVPAYQARFWEPHSLPAAVRDALYAALDAERRTIGTARRSEVQIETRVVEGGSTGYELPDPYSNSMMYHVPPRVVLRRTLGKDGDGSWYGRFESVLPDGTLSMLYAADEARFVWYDLQSRRVQRGPAPPDAGRWLGRPTQLDLLTILMGDGEHTVTADGQTLLVERSWPFNATDQVVQSNWALPFPSTVGLRAGTLVARLSLGGDDHVTALELLHRADDGGETLLQRSVVGGGEPVPAEPSNVLALPPLDDDVLVFESAPDMSPRIVVSPDGEWVGRTFEWPLSSASVVHDAVPDAPPRTLAFEELPGVSWNRLGSSQLWRVSDYWFGADIGTVTLTQGPAPVLGHVLRNGNGSRWTRSEALPVTIDGREQQAWLLAGSDQAILVVELDGLLLHLGVAAAAGEGQAARPAEDLLRGPVREALAALIRQPARPSQATDEGE